MFLKKAFCSLLMQLFKSILLKAGKYIIHPTSTFHGQSFNPLLTKATQQFFVHHHSKKQELKQKSVQVQDFCLTTKLTLLLSQSYAEDNMAVIEMKRSRAMYPAPVIPYCWLRGTRTSRQRMLFTDMESLIIPSCESKITKLCKEVIP